MNLRRLTVDADRSYMGCYFPDNLNEYTRDCINEGERVLNILYVNGVYEIWLIED